MIEERRPPTSYRGTADEPKPAAGLVSRRPAKSVHAKHTASALRERLNIAGNERGVVKHQSAFDVKSFLGNIGEGRTIGSYRKGQVIYSQGDFSSGVFYIQKGKVKVTVISEQGKEAVAGIFGADEFFGEACVTGQAHRLSTLTAMTDAAILRIEKAVFIKMIHEEPFLSDMFIRRILGRNIRVEADLVDQLFNSSEKRLARLLLLLANFGTEGDQKVVIAKISQETLAEMIGTTRSRVSFFMNKFRKLGFIDYKGRIEVRRSLLNFLLHDQPKIDM